MSSEEAARQLSEATATLQANQTDRFLAACLACPDAGAIELVARSFALRVIATGAARGPGPVARPDAEAADPQASIAQALAVQLLAGATHGARWEAAVRGLLSEPDQAVDEDTEAAPAPGPRTQDVLHAMLDVPDVADPEKARALLLLARTLCNSALDEQSVQAHLSSVFPLSGQGQAGAPLQSSMLSVDNDFIVSCLASAVKDAAPAVQIAFVQAALPPGIHCEVRQALMAVVVQAWSTPMPEGGEQLAPARFHLLLRALLLHPDLDTDDRLMPFQELVFKDRWNRDQLNTDLQALFALCVDLPTDQRREVMALLHASDDEDNMVQDADGHSMVEQALRSAGELPQALRGQLAYYFGRELEGQDRRKFLGHCVLPACRPAQPAGAQAWDSLVAVRTGLLLAQKCRIWALDSPMTWTERAMAMAIDIDRELGPKRILRAEVAKAFFAGAWSDAPLSELPRLLGGLVRHSTQGLAQTFLREITEPLWRSEGAELPHVDRWRVAVPAVLQELTHTLDAVSEPDRRTVASGLANMVASLQRRIEWLSPRDAPPVAGADQLVRELAQAAGVLTEAQRRISTGSSSSSSSSSSCSSGTDVAFALSGWCSAARVQSRPS